MAKTPTIREPREVWITPEAELARIRKTLKRLISKGQINDSEIAHFDGLLKLAGMVNACVSKAKLERA